MKTTIALFLSLLVSASAYSQASIDGFWGIKFGSSRSEVMQKMLAKDGVTFISQRSDAEMLVYKANDFADERCETIVFFFVDDKMYEGGAFLAPLNESAIFDLYHDMVDKISLKYGRPSETFMEFTEPFTENDGKTIDAIKARKANIASFWEFKGELLGRTNMIGLNITPEMKVIVFYQDTHWSGVANEEKMKKVLNDL